MSESATGSAGDHPEFDEPPGDPMPLLREWLERAPSHGVPEPMVASLATVRDGAPTSRFVALKEVTDDGVVFSTGELSPKGQDIQANPKVALNLYWPQTMQQLRMVGQVEVLDDERAEAIFAARSREARAATIVAEQSEPMGSEAELRRRAKELAESDDELPRPATQRAYHAVLDEVEFWVASADRLHRRLAYTRDGSEWTSLRLQP